MDLTNDAQNLTRSNIEPRDWVKLTDKLKGKATNVATKLWDAKYAINVQFPEVIELDQTDLSDTDSENEDESEWTDDESANSETNPTRHPGLRRRIRRKQHRWQWTTRSRNRQRQHWRNDQSANNPCVFDTEEDMTAPTSNNKDMTTPKLTTTGTIE